ncbi:unnamed protein product [Onchocerca flexuosa]|uniref:Uncharacterized protein n=1 Tax=Onchocerca flexuosa TaxID=387005 RepID=A0A183H9E0_9BILA|nr:unnamed protein product [Onchocerca flexuosa]
MATYELCCDMIDVTIDISSIYGCSDDLSCAVFDSQSSAVIHLRTDQVLFLRQVNMFLALVCIIRSENFEKQGLIDYNFQCFKGIQVKTKLDRISWDGEYVEYMFGMNFWIWKGY